MLNKEQLMQDTLNDLIETLARGKDGYEDAMDILTNALEAMYEQGFEDGVYAEQVGAHESV